MAALLGFADLPAEVVTFSDPRDARQALELGDVDLQPGYTGEAWLEVLGRPDPPGDPRESYLAVRDHDIDEDIVWLRPSFGDGLDEPPANATFAFVVQGPPSVDADLRTLSQLAARLAWLPPQSVRPGLFIVITVVLCAAFASWIAPYPEHTGNFVDFRHGRVPPSLEHP
jgi:hypothetical protein